MKAGKEIVLFVFRLHRIEQSSSFGDCEKLVVCSTAFVQVLVCSVIVVRCIPVEK